MVNHKRFKDDGVKILLKACLYRKKAENGGEEKKSASKHCNVQKDIKQLEHSRAFVWIIH